MAVDGRGVGLQASVFAVNSAFCLEGCSPAGLAVPREGTFAVPWGCLCCWQPVEQGDLQTTPKFKVLVLTCLHCQHLPLGKGHGFVTEQPVPTEKNRPPRLLRRWLRDPREKEFRFSFLPTDELEMLVLGHMEKIFQKEMIS